jgi:histidyl-tRNA synthetase
MRVLDSKSPATRAALSGAPTMLAMMDDEGIERFERVKDGLRHAGVDFAVNEHLVRGLDYYTHTVFEIISDALDAANSTIGAGGRYDGLVEQLGGDPTPAFGFGTGVERQLLACEAEGAFEVAPPTPELFVVAFGGDGSDVRDLTLELRRAGWSVGRSFDRRSGRSQMKAADRSGARLAVLLGDDERAANSATLRDLRGDTPQANVARGELIDELRKRLT